jgi:hypothetical protein
MPDFFGNDLQSDVVRRISACIAVLHEQFFAFQIGKPTLFKTLKGFRRHWTVNFSPPDLILAARLSYEKFVVGLTASMFARVYHHGSQVGKQSFTTLYNGFIQGSSRKIPMNATRVSKSVTH